MSPIPSDGSFHGRILGLPIVTAIEQGRKYV